MDLWAQATAATQALLAQYGVVAIALLLLIEEAGLPIPIPGDAVMLLAGVRIRDGQTSLLIVVASLEIATVLGSSFLYFVAGHAGRAAVYRYGRFLHLSPERLNRAEAELQRRGLIAVVLGRMIPGFRILTAMACGVFGIRYRVFLPGMAIGALLYITADVLLGYFFGPFVLAILSNVHLPFDAIGSFVPLAVLLTWLVGARRSLAVQTQHQFLIPDSGARLRGGAQAGAIAALCAALTFNFLAQFASGFLPMASDTLGRQIATRLPPAFDADAFLGIVLDLAVFSLVGVAWGMLYARDFVRRMQRWGIPDAARGMLFALVPLSVTLTLEGLLLGKALGPTAAIGFMTAQTARYLLYGALLGVISPIFVGEDPL